MGHDGVPAGSDKAFDFEILLDGFEEEFDFPTRLVNVGNGEINGSGNHITVHYNSEYMGIFGEHEQSQTVSQVFSWREL